MILLFSSAYDDSSMALESLELSVSVSMSLLCRTIETVSDLSSVFLFVHAPEGDTSSAWGHRFLLSIILGHRKS